jgi:hypothetical protein
LQNQFTADMQGLYGQDINLSSSTPDGQMLGNFVQSSIDVQEVVLQLFTSFDPDQAVGVVLDQRCAINGIQRQYGTYTQTNIAITFGVTGTLYGQDQVAQPVYTVTDNAGAAQWELLTTVTKTAGTYELAFDAATIGPVLTVPGTIQTPVTVVLAVTAINNDQTYTSLGTAQESDNQFKVRRQQSTAIGSQGYYNGLVAQLENIPGIGVGNVKVYENNSGATSNGTVPAGLPTGIPGHTVWVVVGGGAVSQAAIGGTIGANAAAIAKAIYGKRNAGCGMEGVQAYAITQADGSLWIVYWDTVVQVSIFAQFTLGSINGTSFPNLPEILNGTTGFSSLLVPGINQTVNANQIVAAVQAIDPNSYVSVPLFSATWNGSYTATLSPAAGNDQFQIPIANVIITPMIMYSPTSVIAVTQGIPLTFTVTDTAVHSGATLTFTPWGGYSGGGFTFSILVNNSGGSINSSGVYTPGATPNVIDTVKVLDTIGNYATVAVAVS